MPNHPLGKVLNRIRQTLQPRDAVEPTDGQLLNRFIEAQDEGAFEALVGRHGSMVLGVCRRVLRDHHNAEDAFQATFLVLARKALSIRHRELVASWLYGVAFQTALRTRAAVSRRCTREKQVVEMPEPQVWPRDACFDVMPLLDQELSRLPEKYRLPIVLCDLEGKGHGEAARQLGWPQGTVSGRLSRARRLLAQRLTRRGVGLSAVAIGAVLVEQARAATVAPALVSSTVKAAGCIAAGNSIAGLVSAKVAALTECAVKSLLVSKLKATVSIGLFIAVLAFGTGLGRRTLHQNDKGIIATGLVVANAAVAGSGDLKQPPCQAFQITFDNLEFVVVDEPDRSVIGLLRDNLHLPFVPPEPCEGERQTRSGRLQFRAEGDSNSTAAVTY